MPAVRAILLISALEENAAAVSGMTVGPLLQNVSNDIIHGSINLLPLGLRITSVTLLVGGATLRNEWGAGNVVYVIVTLLDNTFILDDSGDSRSSGSGVVRHCGRLRFLNLWPKDRGGRDGQGSLNVDLLGSGSSEAKKPGCGEREKHVGVVNPGVCGCDGEGVVIAFHGSDGSFIPCVIPSFWSGYRVTPPGASGVCGSGLSVCATLVQIKIRDVSIPIASIANLELTSWRLKALFVQLRAKTHGV